MKKWKVYGTGLVTLASLCPNVRAQVPAVGPPAALAPVAAVPAAPPPAGLFAFLGLTKDQKAAMRAKCCQTPLGQLLNGMLAPVRVFSGGVVGNFCPPNLPSPADLAKPGAEGAAAKIQLDEAGVKARRAAVRYLGTVDCHYWPEAQDALIDALRCDKNECVRWEAAMALGGGCCCTKKTIEALLISATGVQKDNCPSETCERVREAAMVSLQHCLECFSQEVPPEPVKPVKPETPGRPEKPRAQAVGGVQLTAFYQNLDNVSLAACVQDARQAIGNMPSTATPAGSLPTGARSVFNILSNAAGDSSLRRRGATVVSIRPTGTENGTSQPEPIPMASFSPAPVPEPPVAEKKPAPAPLSRLRSVVAESAAKRQAVSTPVTPEPAPVVVKPEPAPVQIVPPRPRIIVPDSQPGAVPQKQSRAPAGADPEPFLATLKRSIYPFQREWAVESLAGCDWQMHPEVLSAVLATAKKDAAPTVRAACVRVLMKKRVGTPDAVTVVQELRNDPDPRVVHEAAVALPQLEGPQRTGIMPANVVASSTAGSPAGTIQPASYTVPSSPASRVIGR